MGRNPRIEFEGAVYHVMSRGNRREAIFLDAHDNQVFLDLLEEVCGRTGWAIHAYVLMGNHYHLLLETPEPNLVDGMRWLQGTYTKRFNIRHKQWGHLFQGRYKALLVDPGKDYFPTVCNYIHLNPARAKGFDPGNDKLANYPWSSFSFYLRPSKRPDWLSVERTLGNLGLADDRSGRSRYRNYVHERVFESIGGKTPEDMEEDWAKIRRGWCFGSDEFRDQMVELLDGVMRGKRRDSFGGDEAMKHDELEAMRLLRSSLNALGLKESELGRLKKNDSRKKVAAWLIRKNTSVRNEWISKRLNMGSASKLSSFVKEVEETKDRKMAGLKKRAIR